MRPYGHMGKLFVWIHLSNHNPEKMAGNDAYNLLRVMRNDGMKNWCFMETSCR
jgi:hypothetical protein